MSIYSFTNPNLLGNLLRLWRRLRHRCQEPQCISRGEIHISGDKGGWFCALHGGSRWLGALAENSIDVGEDIELQWGPTSWYVL